MANLRLKDVEKALSTDFITPGKPSPARKRDFILHLEPSGTSFLVALLTQLGYIRLRLWISSLLFIIIAFLVTFFLGASKNSIYMLSALLPFISLTAIGELMKSSGYQMEELEMSCRYNLSHVMLMRMIIIGITYCLLLGLSLLLSTYISGHLLTPNTLYVITPFLLTNTLTLWISQGSRRQDTGYICGVIASFISLASLYIPTRLPMLYTPSMTPVWLVTCLILMPLMFYPLALLQKSTYESQHKRRYTYGTYH